MEKLRCLDSQVRCPSLRGQVCTYAGQCINNPYRQPGSVQVLHGRQHGKTAAMQEEMRLMMQEAKAATPPDPSQNPDAHRVDAMIHAFHTSYGSDTFTRAALREYAAKYATQEALATEVLHAFHMNYKVLKGRTMKELRCGRPVGVPCSFRTMAGTCTDPGACAHKMLPNPGHIPMGTVTGRMSSEANVMKMPREDELAMNVNKVATPMRPRLPKDAVAAPRNEDGFRRQVKNIIGSKLTNTATDEQILADLRQFVEAKNERIQSADARSIINYQHWRDERVRANDAADAYGDVGHRAQSAEAELGRAYLEIERLRKELGRKKG